MKSDLLDQAKHLPVLERIELVEAIWDTVAEDAGASDLPVPQAHLRELDRRLADLRESPRDEVSWQAVREQLKRNG